VAAVFGSQFGARFGAKFGPNNYWGAQFPATGSAFTALTGITLDSLWTFQEASGNVLDKVGSNNLTASGTPTFATLVQGRQGIDYDADGDRHAAAVLDPASTSFIAFAVYAKPHGAFSSIMGGYDSASADEGWLVYETGGTVKFDVRDTGVNSLVLTSAAVSSTSTLHLVSIQVDRAANTLRARVTPLGGTAQSLSGSIAGFASFSAGANHVFGFGGMPLLNSSAVFYGGMRINADTEGATKLAALHRGLGWE
jgi:hypothetical protein